MTRTDDPGPEHDAYLRSALRHAPDAALGPSEAIDDAILRRARSATTEAASPEAAQPGMPLPHGPPRAYPSAAEVPRARDSARGLAGWWAWLARPSVATGFAGVMVATLVGVMWWGRPLDETMPPRFEAPAPAAPAATDPSPAAAAKRSDASTAAPGPSPSGPGIASSTVPRSVDKPITAAPAREPARPDASRGNATGAEEPVPPIAPARMASAQVARRKVEPSAFPAPPDAAAEAQTRERRADPERSARAEIDASRARSAGAADEPVAPTPSAAAPRSMERFEIAAPRAPASPPASPPATAMADAAPNARGPLSATTPTEPTSLQKSRADAERLTAQAVPASPTSERPAAASAQRDAAPRGVVGALEDRKADSGEAARGSAGAIARNRAGPPTRSPLAPLRTALATEPARWTWSADGRRMQRVTPELLAWLARLDAALAARPIDGKGAASAPESEDAAPPPAPSGPVRALVLLQEGRRHTELRLGEALEVTPIDPPGPRWRVPLAPETAAALRESLP